ncbi:hypothetical protein [Aquabacterium sp. J223]|uniref:hypothetical protein n=1 Tax=Aquabacterium sp. J223 TaxID=2898431 RepID=UPI0021ADA7F1|nr:hypothetical protein [Aquabacterium sp. J223]UUX95025.1 hypothetical protein LRS07_17520 [Aquabacterium sp. J223]
MTRRLMWIAWPAFLAAAVAEMLIFAFVDPGRLHGPDGEPLGWSRTAVYTGVFVALWATTFAASALTTLLAASPFEQDRCPMPRARRPPACPK